jgi:hypothetical protein
MNVGVVDDTLPIRGHQRTRNGIRSRFVKRLDRDFAEGDLDADARSHQATIELERVKHAAAHGAAANHAKVYLLHRSPQLAAKRNGEQFIFEGDELENIR